MNRPRVFHLIKGLGRGGAECLLPQTIRWGERYRYSVGYFLPSKDALVAELDSLGVPVTCFEARSNTALLLRVGAVARWLHRGRADLLHIHLPLAGVVGRLAARQRGVPVVYTEHNLQDRYHPWTRLANQWTWNLQRQVVAVSREVADSIESHLGTAVPVQVVHNGIEVGPLPRPSRMGSPVRHALAIPDDAPVVGTVAVFRDQKRLDLWLEAAARLHGDPAPEHPAHFLLVGDGPLRASLEDRVRNLGLGGRVHLPGLQEDVRPYLAAMDVFLMSSRYEGLPLALLEAQAAGLPVVATAVGGVPEVIRDGRTGILVPFGEVGALVAALERLLGDPGFRRAMGDRGRRRVESEFSVHRMVRELEAIYDHVLL